MKIADLKAGTEVWTVGLRGENGAKTHLFSGTIILNDEGAKVIKLAPYLCDGDYMQQGNGGLYRGVGGIIAVRGEFNAEHAIDAAITCEVCRAKMGLPEVAKSAAARQTVEAMKQEKKDAAKAQKTAEKKAARIDYLKRSIPADEARVAEAAAFLAKSFEQNIIDDVNAFVAEYGPYPPEAVERMLKDEGGHKSEYITNKRKRENEILTGYPKGIAKKRAELATLEA